MRRSSRRPGWEPGRSWTPGEGGLLCLHPEPPAVGYGPAQRFAPPLPESGLEMERSIAGRAREFLVLNIPLSPS